MLKRIKDSILDILRQADWLLLCLCCGAALFGLVMIASATNFLGSWKMVIVQACAIVLGVGIYFLMSQIDLTEASKRWKWLLGFGIVALKRDSSEEQQEIYRQEREEAIRLRQEVMAERKQEMQDAYNAMKRRRAERLAAQGMAPTAAQADVVDAVEMVEAVEAEAAEAVEMAEQADSEKEEKTS